MGIGKAVALQLARDKANLILVDIAVKELAETCREARPALPRRCHPARHDVLGRLTPGL
jgi:NAD(P)-dependent dehydrogenase (short-subunit alcohol dehydrogenase family)